MSTTAKKTYQEPKKQASVKTAKVYHEKKKSWIDRLADYFAKRMEDTSSVGYPPVGNLRRLLSYFIDFFLANVLCCIPFVIIQGIVNDTTNITQDLRVMDISYAYVTVFLAIVLYLFYYVFVPYKIWSGQTPGKRLLGYRIVMQDNSDVTLKALCMRHVVGLVCIEGAMFLTTYILQLICITIGLEQVPQFISYVYYFILLLSVLVTMTNASRRMFHDMIAKTKTYKLDEEQTVYKSF